MTAQITWCNRSNGATRSFASHERPCPMRLALPAATALLLASCGGASTDDIHPQTVRAAMTDLIEPASDQIQTIAFELYNEEGDLEPSLLNASQWDALDEAARTIEQTALALEAAPGMPVAAEGETLWNEDSDGASTAADVAAYIAADPAGYASEARKLAGIGQGIALAAEMRDPIALDEAALALTDSCTSCHNQFWYKQED